MKDLKPKEKAKELVSKFTFLTYPESDAKFYNPKQCVIIAVDEILWEIIKYADNSREYVVENSKYWQEVKSEIEKL